MERREALKKAMLALGGVLSGPTLLAFDNFEKNILLTGDFTLNAMQKRIVAEVAEMIIPRTTTAGAKDVGVPAFIEMMMRDCFRAQEQNNFRDGLEELKTSGFLNASTQNKTLILKKLESKTKEIMAQRNVKQTKIGDNDDKEISDKAVKGTPFWRLIKELTLLGYFTSEKGIKQNFDYHQIPGKLEIIKLKKGQKAFAY